MTTRSIAVMTGKAGAGKTTIARYLVDECGFERVRFAGTLKAMASALGLSYDEIDGHLKDEPSEKLTFERIGHVIAKLADAFTAFGFDENAYSDLADENTPLELFGGKSLAHAGTTLVHTILDCVAKGDPVHGATPRSLMQMIGTEWGRERIAQDVWIKAWLRQVAKVPEGTPVVVDDCRFPNEAEACMRAGQATFFRVTRGTETRLAGAVEQGHESERHVLGHHYVISNNFHPRDAGEQVRHLLWDAAKRGNPALKGLSAA